MLEEHRLNGLAHEVIGAAIEVHRAFGPGHVERIYERAMRVELDHRGLSYANQVEIPLTYRGISVGRARIDLLVGGALVVELKAIAQVAEVHRVQTRWYLHAGGYELGLLINFHTPMLIKGVTRVAVRDTHRKPLLNP